MSLVQVQQRPPECPHGETANAADLKSVHVPVRIRVGAPDWSGALNWLKAADCKSVTLRVNTGGSNPPPTTNDWTGSSRGKSAGLKIRRSPARNRPCPPNLPECRNWQSGATQNRIVEGSTPFSGTKTICHRGAIGSHTCLRCMALRVRLSPVVPEIAAVAQLAVAHG